MSTTKLMTTWSDFELLDTPEEGKLELHDGEVVLRMPPASPKHLRICERIAELLRRAHRAPYVVCREFPYRPAQDMQFWYADVAVITEEHARRNEEAEGWVPGLVPELIVEVVSPSNRESKIRHQQLLAIGNGYRSFWTVDPTRRRIEILNAQGVAHSYESDTEVFPGVTVADILDGAVR